MPEVPDVGATGLDTETHICVVIPGFIILAGIVSAALVVPPVKGALVAGLEGLRSTTWLAEALAVVIVFVTALALGPRLHQQMVL